MPVQPTLVAQLIVMQTVEYAGEIRAWATKVPELTLSNLLREALEVGWPRVRIQLEREHGRLSPAELHAGMLASVPKADRAGWIKTHPAPRARARAA